MDLDFSVPFKPSENQKVKYFHNFKYSHGVLATFLGEDAALIIIGYSNGNVSTQLIDTVQLKGITIIDLYLYF